MADISLRTTKLRTHNDNFIPSFSPTVLPCHKRHATPFPCISALVGVESMTSKARISSMLFVPCWLMVYAYIKHIMWGVVLGWILSVPQSQSNLERWNPPRLSIRGPRAPDRIIRFLGMSRGGGFCAMEVLLPGWTKSGAAENSKAHRPSSISRPGLVFLFASACLLACFCVAGSLEITRPAGSGTVMLGDDGEMDIEVDLGRFVVPRHGYLVVYVDGEEAAIYCPERTATLAQCPLAGGEGRGELQGKGISLRIGGGSQGGVGSVIKPGARAVSVALVDATMGVLREASIALKVVAAHEVDKELPRGDAFNAIIFSKDRACQLDQLLSSIEAHVENLGTLVKIQVLYTFSANSFRQGYEELKKMHPLVAFHHEGNLTEGVSSVYSREHANGAAKMRGFKSDYLRLLDADSPYTLHFVDDMVMVREWGLLQQLHAHRMLSTRQDVVAHSLRSKPPESPPGGLGVLKLKLPASVADCLPPQKNGCTLS